MILYFWLFSILYPPFLLRCSSKRNSTAGIVFSFFLTSNLTCDKGQNLFCKSNHNAACKGQKAICSLRGIVRFQGQTDLHDTKAKHNHSDSPYQTEDKVGQIIDNSNRIACGKGCHRAAKHNSHRHHHHTVKAKAQYCL